MTDPSPKAPKRSLAMQRIAINRGRTFAVAAIVIGVLWVALAVALLYSKGSLAIHLAQLILGLAFLVLGVRRLMNARKELRRFEDENGVGAGDQKPVS